MKFRNKHFIVVGVLSLAPLSATAETPAQGAQAGVVNAQATQAGAEDPTVPPNSSTVTPKAQKGDSSGAERGGARKSSGSGISIKQAKSGARGGQGFIGQLPDELTTQKKGERASSAEGEARDGASGSPGSAGGARSGLEAIGGTSSKSGGAGAGGKNSAGVGRDGLYRDTTSPYGLSNAEQAGGNAQSGAGRIPVHASGIKNPASAGSGDPSRSMVRPGLSVRTVNGIGSSASAESEEVSSATKQSQAVGPTSASIATSGTSSEAITSNASGSSQSGSDETAQSKAETSESSEGSGGDAQNVPKGSSSVLTAGASGESSDGATTSAPGGSVYSDRGSTGPGSAGSGSSLFTDSTTIVRPQDLYSDLNGLTSQNGLNSGSRDTGSVNNGGIGRITGPTIVTANQPRTNWLSTGDSGGRGSFVSNGSGSGNGSSGSTWNTPIGSSTLIGSGAARLPAGDSGPKADSVDQDLQEASLIKVNRLDGSINSLSSSNRDPQQLIQIVGCIGAQCLQRPDIIVGPLPPPNPVNPPAPPPAPPRGGGREPSGGGGLWDVIPYEEP